MYVSIFLLDNIVKKAGYIMNKRRYLIAEGQSEYTYDELSYSKAGRYRNIFYAL